MSTPFRPSPSLAGPFLAITLALGAASSTAWAQTLGAPFVADYSLHAAGPVPGVPGSYGGLAFVDGDPSRLLVVGASATPGATLYEVPVTRDAFGHVDGLGATATVVASVPEADGGLGHGPGGVLLYTTWPSNSLGQLAPGSTAPDRVVDLGPLGVSPSTGGLAVTPAGFAQPGKLRLTSFDGSYWYSANLVPDGSGTFDVAGVAFGADLWIGFIPPGSEAIVHVPASAPAFAVPSALVCEWNTDSVGAHELDAAGDVVASAHRPFLESFQCSGATCDPVTGDFLFIHYGSGDVLVVRTTRPAVGSTSCAPAVANSTGRSGEIRAVGSPSTAANELTLIASSLPAGAFGFFLSSQVAGLTSGPGGSQGVLCLGGPIGRFVGPGQVQSSGTIGLMSLEVDLGALPTPTGLVAGQPGETWRFQAWYRDANPGVTSNFTDAVRVDLQ